MTPVLTHASRDDAGVIAGWLNRPEVSRYLTENLRHGGMTPMLVAAGLRRRDQLWMLFASDCAAPPGGLIALDGIETGDGHANVWFLLGDQSLAGRGLTSTALKRFCEENPGGLHTLTAWAVDENVASLRCMEKAGFELVGRIREGAVIDGRRGDRVVMQRLLRRG